MKRAAVLLLTAAALVSGAAVWAAGGESLITKSYIDNTYIPSVVETAAQKVADGTDKSYQAALSALNGKHSGYLSLAGGESSYAAAMTELRLKKGDTVTLSTGSGGMLLAGSAKLTVSGTAVVDVTAGQTAAAGTDLVSRHRYLAGEGSAAIFTVTSDTAVVSVEGYYSQTSGAGVDYNALADALAEMGLFQGTGTAYGKGYDLEVTATRVMGVVMFLRLIGEEEAALASTATCPFADAPAWSQRYLAYAYEKGYTNGVGADGAGRLYFAPDRAISAAEYMTLILRALGYTDSGASPDFTWDTAVSRSVDLGVLTPGEQAMLEGGGFRRAQVVYLSYFSLNAPRKGGGVLLDLTAAGGKVDANKVRQIMAAVTVPRQ